MPNVGQTPPLSAWEGINAEPSHVAQRLLASIPEAVIAVDAAGHLTYVNPQAEALFGHALRIGQRTARYTRQICSPNGSPLADADLPAARALRGQVITGEEMLLRRLDGRGVPLLVNAGPVRDAAGQISGAILVLDDLTPLKELERLRLEWTSIIAHDLRQPVTVVIGYASQLAKLSGPESAPLQKPLEHILTSAQQLRRMINDLLDVSRLEASHLALERQPVDLAQLIYSVTERIAEIAADHPVRVAFTTRETPRLHVDPSRIEQILGNLLSNAAKYGYPGTEIQVDVAALEREVEIAVTNAGDGIPSDELPHLFTRFHRPRSHREPSIPGLGLGLYIARGLVEAHGGRIWAESSPGQLTTFHFTLPEDPRGS